MRAVPPSEPPSEPPSGPLPEPPAERPTEPPSQPAAPPAGPGLSAPERARVRDTLDAAHRAATARLHGLTGHVDELVAASAHSNADDEHDPEGATIAFERSQLGSLVTRAESQLTEIDAARGRLAAGSYGVCEGCGRPVGTARLEVLPTARTCIACATRAGGRRT